MSTQDPAEQDAEEVASVPPIPDVDNSAGEDQPPTVGENPALASSEAKNDKSVKNAYQTSDVDDPEKQHRRSIEFKKLYFGMSLIVGCLAIVTVVGILDYYLPKEGSSFTSLSDLLKLVSTTVLGYVFGRGIGPGKEES